MNRSLKFLPMLVCLVAAVSLSACSDEYKIKTSGGNGHGSQSQSQSPADPSQTTNPVNPVGPVVLGASSDSSNSSSDSSASTSEVSSGVTSSGSTSLSSSSSSSSSSQTSSITVVTVPISTSSSSSSSSSSSTSAGQSESIGTSESSSAVSSASAAPNLQSITETFPLAQKEVKKIDFLFVVDNSPSTKPIQEKLAAGFKSFADKFYHRQDLDICTRIITSDRYLGLIAKNYDDSRHEHSTEFEIPCVKGSSPDVDDVIAKFKQATNVGVIGNEHELLGKSVQTFLSDVSAGRTSAFFRKDAVANISFLTDENNWFYYTGPEDSIPEAFNDLPATAGSKVGLDNKSAKDEYYTQSAVPGVNYQTFAGFVDHRKGIKESLDEFFTSLNPESGLSYSVTPILSFRSDVKLWNNKWHAVNQRTGLEYKIERDSARNLARNILELARLVGRESQVGDLHKDAQSYTDLYTSVGEAIVKRTAAIHLKQNPYDGGASPMRVLLIRGDESLELRLGSDYSVMAPNGVVLSDAVIKSLQPGDLLRVTYDYLQP